MAAVGNYENDNYEKMADARDNDGPFSNAVIRNGFIRKVYGLVAIQLGITAVIAGGISQAVPLHTIRPLMTPALLISCGLLIALNCAIARNPTMMRKSPTNYIMLLGFTVVMSVMVGLICVRYQAQSVALAFGLTMGIFLGLTAFAFTTKQDFTGMGAYLFAAMLGLFCMGLVFCFIPSETGQAVQAGLGAILFSFYIVYDTQLIMGGRHKKYQFDIDDYAFAALNIYLDIINLFLYILELVGDRR